MVGEFNEPTVESPFIVGLYHVLCKGITMAHVHCIFKIRNGYFDICVVHKPAKMIISKLPWLQRLGVQPLDGIWQVLRRCSETIAFHFRGWYQEMRRPSLPPHWSFRMISRHQISTDIPQLDDFYPIHKTIYLGTL